MRLAEIPERERERETPTQTWITFDTLDIVSRKLIREEEKKRTEAEFVGDSEGARAELRVRCLEHVA